MKKAKVIPDGFDFPWLDTNFSRPGSTTRDTGPDHSPLIMHNRAFSPDTTYNKSWFVIEKDLALPVDEALFTHIMMKAGLDEGLLSFSLSNPRLYGKSIYKKKDRN
jgi:hypothetical protein